MSEDQITTPAVTETPEPKQTVVLFGNSSPQMQVPILHPETGLQVGLRSEPARHLNQSVTRVELWQGVDDPDFVEHSLSTPNDRFLHLIGRSLPDEHRRYAVAVSEVEQVVQVHTAGGAPDWVRSNDPELAKALGAHFNCPVGEPVALQPTVGRDALHAQAMSTSAQPAAFNYMALANSATATAPAGADTTLVGEITTAGGGLLRAQATYAHTVGTNTTTLTKTFTANGTDALPVTVSQAGIFNAATNGTLGWKSPLNSNATLNVSGDNVTVTETINIG